MPINQTNHKNALSSIIINYGKIKINKLVECNEV
jgi:hypothetical protein